MTLIAGLFVIALCFVIVAALWIVLCGGMNGLDVPPMDERHVHRPGEGQ